MMKDGIASNCHEDIADNQSAFRSGTILFNAHHQETCLLLALEGILRNSGHVNSLTANANIAALDLTVFGKSLTNFPGDICGDGNCRSIRKTGSIQSQNGS